MAEGHSISHSARHTRWPVGLASLFQSHRLLQKQLEDQEAEVIRLREENAAYRDLVLMLRSVPPLRTGPKEPKPPIDPISNGRPTMADIQRKNRLRMIDEAARKSGAGTDEEREQNRKRMAAAADEYAAAINPAG